MKAHFLVVLSLLLKLGKVQNHLYEISFLSHTKKLTLDHMNGLALGLSMKRSLRATRKWLFAQYAFLSLLKI